jgi:hypothetical protein
MVPLEEENIVNCVRNENTNFAAKIKKSDRVHCKNEIIEF